MRKRLAVVAVLGLAIAVVVVAILQTVQTAGGRDVARPAVIDLNDAFVPPVIREVEIKGAALRLSGEAEPGAELNVRPDEVMEAGDTTAEGVRVSDDGEWSLELRIDPTQPQSLSVESRVGEQRIAGDDTVIVLPAPGAGEGIAQRPLVAVTVPGGPSRIVQTPFGKPLREGALSLVAIDYDGGGGSLLAGRSDRAGTVELSSAGERLGEAVVTPDGWWYFIATGGSSEGERSFEIVLREPSTDVAALSVVFEPLRPGEMLRQTPDSWQLRRRLDGGGSQVTAIFATPVQTEDALPETTPETTAEASESDSG